MCEQETPTKLSPIQSVGLICLVAVIFIGTSLTGFFFDVGLTLRTGVILSLILGGIGGFLIVEDTRLGALIAGAAGGPCVTLATYYYTAFRETLWSAEIVIVACVAAVPGGGLYRLIRAILPPSEKPEEPES